MKLSPHWLFVILLIAASIIVLRLVHLSEKPKESSFCDQFSGDVKELCVNATRTCSGEGPGYWGCISATLIETDIEAAKKACEQIEFYYDQKVCFASALLKINKTLAEEVCDEIEAPFQRAFCHGLVLQKLGSSDALKPCEELEMFDEMVCKALLTKNIDPEKAREYCEQLEGKERDLCLSKIS